MKTAYQCCNFLEEALNEIRHDRTFWQVVFDPETRMIRLKADGVLLVHCVVRRDGKVELVWVSPNHEEKFTDWMTMEGFQVGCRTVVNSYCEETRSCLIHLATE